MILPPLMIRPSISSVPGLKDELSGLTLTIDNLKQSMSNGNNQTPQNLAKVATTGNYSDLIGCPTMFSKDYKDLLNKPVLFSGVYADLSGLPVLFSGKYDDLIGKPVIPTVSYPVTSVSGRTGNITLSANDISGLATVAKTNDYNDLLNKPSNVTPRRVETYLGNTDASGNYTVVYSTPFIKVPDVQPQLQVGNYNQFIKITSSTTTGFTVSVAVRNSVSITGIEVLLAATTVVNGASVGVLVTQRI